MIQIIGAGMAGLLSSAMLGRITGSRPTVRDAQSRLPDNHGALLRFRTDAVSHETGIRFKKVRVFKAVNSGGRLRPVASVRDANLYAFKVTGAIATRSIMDLTPCDRYIAPPDFCAQLARDQYIRLNEPLTALVLSGLKGQRDLVTISTIPMPALMELVGWGAKPAFRWLPIWSVTLEFEEPAIDIYQTIYYPELSHPHYRASFTGNKCIIEFAREPDDVLVANAVRDVKHDFGIPSQLYTLRDARRQEYGKLLPLTERGEEVRREFIMAMTDEYNLYSVGRFATWRQLLLDDVVLDLHTVANMVLGRDAYLNRLRGARS